MSEQNEQLLPCPFCGGHAQDDFIEDVSYIIECYVCETTTGCQDSAAAAVAAWNRRAQPAPTVQAGEERFDSALATFLAEHTRLTQDGIDQHAASIAAALNDEALRPVPAEDIEFWIEEGYLTAPAHASSDGRDAAEWLRNNYQAYPNIADLCEAMCAALAGTGVKGGGA